MLNLNQKTDITYKAEIVVEASTEQLEYNVFPSFYLSLEFKILKHFNLTSTRTLNSA